MPTFRERVRNSLQHAWNAFTDVDQTNNQLQSYNYGPSYARQPTISRTGFGTDRTIIPSIYTRLAVDGAAIDMRHVDLDDDGQYEGTRDSGINNCLTVRANVDQRARAFKQDMIWTLVNEGAIAIVPTDTTLNPNVTGGYDVTTMRVGKIISWMPQDVRVSVWDEVKGTRREMVFSKNVVAVVENPFYSVMNETNSTLQRLLRALNQLDAIDEQSSSGKLDIIIQLPYVTKTETQQNQAKRRQQSLQDQLKDSQYGIGYIDATEKITQLNRPAENNMMAKIEYLTGLLYSQLGMPQAIFDGTADDATLLNYYNSTLEPILAAIQESIETTFLTQTARTQNQAIRFFRNPFKTIATKDMGDLVDKLSRNAVVTANEFRSVFGLKPSSDPGANQLVNKNMPTDKTPGGAITPANPITALTPPDPVPVEMPQVKPTPLAINN